MGRYGAMDCVGPLPGSPPSESDSRPADALVTGILIAPPEQRRSAVIRPYLEANERVSGIPLERLLAVHGRAERPERVYRKIRPAEHPALSPEEAWVKREA